MKSIVWNQPPVTFQADHKHDNSHLGWIEPRTFFDTMCRGVHKYEYTCTQNQRNETNTTTLPLFTETTDYGEGSQTIRSLLTRHGVLSQQVTNVRSVPVSDIWTSTNQL